MILHRTRQDSVVLIMGVESVWDVCWLDSAEALLFAVFLALL